MGKAMIFLVSLASRGQATYLVSSPGFMNLRFILTLRYVLPEWKTQIQQHLEWLLSGSICLAKARPHRISDWLVDLSLVWLSESCASVRSRELYVRSLGKLDFVSFFFFFGSHGGLAPECNQPCIFSILWYKLYYRQTYDVYNTHIVITDFLHNHHH